jgi:hypothetical protein
MLRSGPGTYRPYRTCGKSALLRNRTRSRVYLSALSGGFGRRQINAERPRLLDDEVPQFLVRHLGEFVRSAVLDPVVEVLGPNGGGQFATRRRGVAQP